jgi:hypothetical protein
MKTLFDIQEVEPKPKESKEELKVKTLHDLIHKPRFTLKKNKKIRNYYVKVFIVNKTITFKFKDDEEISGTIDELKNIHNFAKNFKFPFGTSKWGCHVLYGENKTIRNYYVNITKPLTEEENVTINIDNLPLSLNEIEKIINEGERQYILKYSCVSSNLPLEIKDLKTFLDWDSISIEKNKYYHYSIPDGLQDGLVKKEFNLEEIFVI